MIDHTLGEGGGWVVVQGRVRGRKGKRSLSLPMKIRKMLELITEQMTVTVYSSVLILLIFLLVQSRITHVLGVVK